MKTQGAESHAIMFPTRSTVFYPIRLQRQEELYALGHQSLMQEGEFKAQMMLMT